MRINARKVFEAFHAGRYYKKVPSFWTDGIALYSYGTCLFDRKLLDGNVMNPIYIFNDTKYSITTTIYQNSICEELYIDRKTGFSTVLQKFLAVLHNVPRGTQDLSKHTREVA